MEPPRQAGPDGPPSGGVGPRIQYAQTKDGVSIAYWALGEGRPLVHMPYPRLSHVQLEWQRPEWRSWYERLIERRRLIRYDTRGTGLSDRNRIDYSVDSLVLDLAAVVDRLELDRFALFAPRASGPAAIAYAARYPERVSHLLLWCTWARAPTGRRSAQLQIILALRDQDWELYTETYAHVVLGWSAGEQARRYAAFIRQSLSPESSRALDDATGKFDVAQILPQVQVPTLVLHRSSVPVPSVDVARELASSIPNASLALVEGSSHLVYAGDTEATLRAIDEFLGEGAEPATEAPAPGGLVTILFTDIESSTSTRQRLGDARAQELLRTHNTIVRDALKTNGGAEIKHTGDGIMASFPLATGALDCAIAIQQGLAAQQADTPLRVYIGLNAGEPIAEDDDLFGTSVDLAKRICDHAQPGEILVSDVVRQLAAGKDFLFSDQGETVLRGFEDPVRLFELRWRESAGGG